MSFNFMAAVIICSDFGTQVNINLSLLSLSLLLLSPFYCVCKLYIFMFVLECSTILTFIPMALLKIESFFSFYFKHSYLVP